MSEQYTVALLNSKNAWRILGQESYSYEISQDLDYDLNNTVVVLPIGNAGNITAVISGFIKFYEAGIITNLPKIVGVQSAHANPVFAIIWSRTSETEVCTGQRHRSVAQAAMIGNPVSMPRVIHLVEQYNRLCGRQNVFIVEVEEQAIMDWELPANRNGHIACTHGGESLAGLVKAIQMDYVDPDETAIVDSTAHALKFSGFQDMYFNDSFPAEFGVKPDPELVNAPVYVHPPDLAEVPGPGRPLDEKALKRFVKRISDEIASALALRKSHEAR